jgi:hypothetical protein
LIVALELPFDNLIIDLVVARVLHDEFKKVENEGTSNNAQLAFISQQKLNVKQSPRGNKK